MITAKIPRTGVATQFQLNPQDIKIVAKLVDKLSKDSDFSGTITANLKAFGLPLWKAFSFPVNVDFSTLIQVPWSSLPPACLEWTNRTPDNFWPEKKVILKMKKAGVALTPMCSPKDGKLSLDFGTAFSHEELLKTIPKFKVILIFLKDFLFKHKKIIKSNLLVQAMFWVMESHACGKPLENIFKNQDLKIAQPTKPNPCLGMGEFAIECLAFLKLALVEKKLPSYFLPRMNILDFGQDTENEKLKDILTKGVLKFRTMMPHCSTLAEEPVKANQQILQLAMILDISLNGPLNKDSFLDKLMEFKKKAHSRTKASLNGSWWSIKKPFENLPEMISTKNQVSLVDYWS